MDQKRESAFETLQHSNVIPNNTPKKIPQSLFDKCEKEFKGKAQKREGEYFCCFKYNIENRYFNDYELRQFNSLFFEYMKLSDKDKKKEKSRLSDKIIIVKFSKKTPDEQLLTRHSIIEEILRNGVLLGNKTFNIIGCSNSQVAEKVFIFMKGRMSQCSIYMKELVPNINELEKKKGLAKRTKYVGLLFTGCQFIVDMPEEFVMERLKDVQTRKYNFTDGCGLISYKLANQIYELNYDLQKKWKDQIPSIWQIRYYGNNSVCKGVLVVDHSEKEKSVLGMRESMIKIAGIGKKADSLLKLKLGIVSTSENRKIGKLNKQVVALLSVNVDADVLLAIQKEQHGCTMNIRTDPQAAFKYAAVSNKWQEILQVLRKFSLHKRIIIPKPYSLLVKNIKLQKEKQLEKLQVPLPFSRLLFGASIPEYLPELQEGQCVVMTELGPREGPVIVCRSPSYFPGDILVLDAVKCNPTNMVSKLRNVIIFSSNGKRPDPDKMSGGDLDGDLYLVIWDERLLKFKEKLKNEISVHFDQPNGFDKKKDESKRERDWIHYLARWENSLLAQIDSCFYQFAKVNGIKSKECTELAKLFSRLVDQSESDIERLNEICRKSPGRISLVNEANYHRLPVWEKMLYEQMKVIKSLKKLTECPTLDEWEKFYDKLIYCERACIKHFLQKPYFTDVLEKDDISRVIDLWGQICRNKRLVVRPQIIELWCKFDCMETNCKHIHFSAPNFYREEWVKKMENSIKEICKDKLKELEETQQIIDRQERLRMKAVEIENEALVKYNKELEENRRELNQLNITKELQQCCDYEERELQKLLEGREVYKGFRSSVLLLLSRGFRAQRNRHYKMIAQVEGKLLAIFNKCLLRQREMFPCYSDLYVIFETLPSTTFRQNKIKEISKYIEKQERSIVKPKLSLLPTTKKNIKKLINTATCQIEQLEEKKKSQTIQLDKMLEEVTKSEDELRRKTKEKEIIFKKLDNLDSSLELCKQINSQLNYFKCNISDQTLERLQLVATEWSKEDFLIGSLTAKRKMVNAFIMNGENMRKEYEIDIRKVEEVTSRIFSTIQDIEKKVDYLKEDLKEINRRVKELRECVVSYLNILPNVYDSDQMEKVIGKYEKQSENMRCFDLASSALVNEVEKRFYGSDNLKSEIIIEYNKELQLCLERESKRCEREMGNNKLPVFSKRNLIKESLLVNNALIIVAGTGSGKSTQVPQYLADDLHHIIPKTDFPKIVCTQPRRVAAIRIAERVALEYSGQVNVKKLENTGKQVDNPNVPVMNVSKQKIVAYPLYSSLPQEEQDRALDIEDRVGLKKPFTRKSNKTEANEMKSMEGTAGEVGRWVGFQIGSKNKSPEQRKQCRKIGEDTRIHFVTEGLLLQKLRSQNKEYDCIIIDEAHERSRDADLLLAHLYDIIIKKKIDLKVVVMSASIDQQEFSQYFGGCPIIECEGHMFHVGEVYLKLPDPHQTTQYDSEESDTQSNDSSDSDEDDVKGPYESISSAKLKPSYMDRIISHAVDVVFRYIPQSRYTGDVLIFLPGKREIESCVEMINNRAKNETLEQKHVTKVVCCTNIAETSLTIPNVQFVIDSGKVKKMTYDSKIRLSVLRLKDSSQASAKQRKGRAGRVRDGVCYRLYSESYFEDQMPKYDEPEMKQCAIDDLYLYTLNILGCLDEINLMKDAQPEPNTIITAEERLLNFGYIEKNKEKIENRQTNKAKFMVTPRGKLALELKGELSLEATMMVIEAVRKKLISEDVLNTAVILTRSLEDDMLWRTEDENVKNKRKELMDEMGDPLTLLNIYKHFIELNNKPNRRGGRLQRIESWCADISVSLQALEEIKKSTDQVYKILEKFKEHIPTFSEIKIDQIKNHSLVLYKENILKCIVAGYFHNIVECHSEFMMHGYSVITPMNYGMTADETKLLKVKIDRNSSLYVLGDTRENNISLFTSLVSIDQVGIFMKNVSKVRAEWIQEFSSKRWQKSIKLKFTDDLTNIGNIVQKKIFQYTGPIVQNLIWKETVGTPEKRQVRAIEEDSNSVINLSFESGKIFVYGSFDEVNKSYIALNKLIFEKKSEIMENDLTINYPTHPAEPVCEIRSGFQVKLLNVKKIEAVHLKSWDDDQANTVIVINCPGTTEEEMKKYLDRVFDMTFIPYSNARPQPNYVIISKPFTKVRYSSTTIANDVIKRMNLCCHFRRSGCKFFLDRDIEIKVIDTEIYPSVQKIAKKYTMFTVDCKKNLFKIKTHKKTRKDRFEEEKEEFLQTLQAKCIFGCEVIEAVDFNRNIGERTFIFKQVRKYLPRAENGLNVKTRWTKFPPRIEIHGEDRKTLYNRLKQYIDQIRADIESGNKYIITYQRKIKISTRKQLFDILSARKTLRDKHDNVGIKILGGNENAMHNFADCFPVIQLLSDCHSDGEYARQEIDELLFSHRSCFTNGTDQTKCSVCSKQVHIQRGKREKGNERTLLRENRKELRRRTSGKNTNTREDKTERKRRLRGENFDQFQEARRLTLCGCLYCRDCLSTMLFSQLSDGKIRVQCLICNEVVLMKDLFLLSIKAKEMLYELSYKNHLATYGGRTFQSFKCTNCNEWMLHRRSDEGLFRCVNNKCHRLFCVVCRGQVMNRLDFRYHREKHQHF